MSNKREERRGRVSLRDQFTSTHSEFINTNPTVFHNSEHLMGIFFPEYNLLLS